MRYRKKRQRLAKRKEYLLNITKRAFIQARGICKNLQWEKGLRCYHEDYTNCLLQYDEEIDESDSWVVVITAPNNMLLPPDRKVRVKTRELITLKELETQMALVLDQEKYGEDNIISLAEEIRRDMKLSISNKETENNTKATIENYYKLYKKR
jgi:hypothetical protein